MKRFAAWLIGLSVVLAGALWIAALGGRVGSANRVQAVGFNSCGGATCFMGIRPGVTFWEEAKQMLGERARSEPGELRLFSVFVDHRNAIVLNPSVDPDRVGRITYSYFPYAASLLTAGAVIEQYGLPCGVSVYYEEGIVTLRYPMLLANVYMRGQTRIELDAPVYQLQLTDPAFHSKAQPDPCLDNITGWKIINTSWGGFAAIDHYLTRTHR